MSDFFKPFYQQFLSNFMTHPPTIWHKFLALNPAPVHLDANQRRALPAGGHSEGCHTLSIARVLRTLRMDCINPMQLARWREWEIIAATRALGQQEGMVSTNFEGG